MNPSPLSEMSTIESLLTQLAQAANSADPSLRHQLSDQLQLLARSISTPRQIMHHYGYTYTEQVVSRIASDLNIFAILVENDGPIKTEEIANKTHADPALIGENPLST